MTFPYSKFLAAIGRLANVLMDYMDNRKWRDKQDDRQEKRDDIDKWVDQHEDEDRRAGFDRRAISRRNDDRVRQLTGKIKAESSE